MATFAPLKVTITRDINGQFLYPNFNRLAAVKASGLRWQEYVDKRAFGWRFDNKSNIHLEDPESPRGQWTGVLLLPPGVVDEAVSLFPTVCARMTPAEFDTWWSTRHAIRNVQDNDILLGMLLKYFFQFVVDPVNLTPKERAALNPNNPEPGIRTVTLASWATDRGVTIV